MAEVRLKHVVHEIDTVIFFYDGELPVVGGVVTIPDGNDNWAGAAYIHGYQIDPDTGEHLIYGDVVDRALASEVAKSDEKEDADEGAAEGSDAGGQPVSEDGVRTSEQPRDEGVLGRVLRRGNRDRSPDGEAGN